MLLGDRAINTVSVTPSVVFRIRDKVGPVALLLDEADQTMRNRQDNGARDLLAIVNAGYVRSAVVLRNVGQSHEPKAFPAFGPAVISGIATLAPTTESRCIPIILDRKPPGQGEHFLPFLPEIAEDATAIAAELEAWSTDDVVAGLRVARPTYPEGLRDRQIQGWWNLFAIADLAGEGWPSRARTAALALHVAAADDLDALSVGVLLLRHIREAFEEAGVDRLSTTDLLQLLVANEDGPWGRWWAPRWNVPGRPTARPTRSRARRHRSWRNTCAGSMSPPRRFGSEFLRRAATCARTSSRSGPGTFRAIARVTERREHMEHRWPATFRVPSVPRATQRREEPPGEASAIAAVRDILG